jgi:glutamate/tyrosine decarboxylase-like PLP-dependent enzyme
VESAELFARRIAMSATPTGTPDLPGPAPYARSLQVAAGHAASWLATLQDRPVRPEVGVAEVAATLGGSLPEEPTDPAEVVELLAAGVEPGLMAIGSGRFFGWVMGGTLPAALAADWLVSAWDQNAGMRSATPGVVAAEDVAAGWLLDLLGLPVSAAVGFTTGATSANFACLAAARHAVLARVGWDVEVDGLTGAPRVHVLAGAERHGSVDLALRYLGLGEAILVDADAEGRLRPEALTAALAAVPPGAPIIVCLQAGNLHSGAFDPFQAAVDVAHRRDAWVHVDGAFGLWAAASRRLSALMAGCASADSWATDAHKTLNTPYDSGLAIVADRPAMLGALGLRASYLLQATDGLGDPFETVVEMSRRARGVPVWAALRSLGRSGVAHLVTELADRAAQFAAAMRAADGVEVLNEVCYTQVCLAFADDATTRRVADRVARDGVAWMSASRWHDRDVLRVSVSNWTTDATDIARSVEAVRNALAAVGDGD